MLEKKFLYFIGTLSRQKVSITVAKGERYIDQGLDLIWNKRDDLSWVNFAVYAEADCRCRRYGTS